MSKSPSYSPELAAQYRILRDLKEAFPDGLGFGTCKILTPPDDPLRRAAMHVVIENGYIVKASYDPDKLK